MKDVVLAAVGDLAIDLVQYDRREDEDLPLGTIESLIESGELSIEDLVSKFEESLRDLLPE